VSTKVLPDGWTLKKFSAIAASITERVDDPSASGVKRYVGLEHLDPESTTIRRWGSPSDVEATKLRFYPGDVIYGRRRAYQRKLGVAEFDGICSAHALVLRAKPDVCLREFLPFFLQSDAFHQRALDISVGSLSPTINWKTLAVQEFALPPIAAQLRIVEVMEAADQSVGNAERLSSLYLDLICSLIQEIVFNKATNRYEQRPLSSFLRLTSAGSWGADEGVDEVDCRVIRSTEFTNVGSLLPASPAVRSISKETLSKLQLTSGDLLIERSGGTPDRPVGRVISWPGGAPAIPSNFVHLLRVDERQIPPVVLKWILWYLHRTGATRPFQTASTNMRNLRITDYLAQPLPVLTKAERSSLAARLDAADSARSLEESRLESAQHVRAGLLSSLLGGQVVH